MNICRDIIEEIVQDQKILISRYAHEYENSIDGSLSCCINHGTQHYYHAKNEEGKYSRRTIDDNTKVIEELARKEYLRVVIPEIQKCIETMENASCKMPDLEAGALKHKMQKAYRSLPEEYFYSTNDAGEGLIFDDVEKRLKSHEKWARENYIKSSYKTENRKYLTSAGIKVRSKSEQHIVEQLVNYGVPFRYEQVIYVNGFNYSADFTFEDRYHNCFYWEHAGMMDTASYAEGHRNKMKDFEKAGIVPWKNLIITYDVNGGINVPMIKSIIKNEVIPRM